tara:strand:- start:74551 stop:75252 length:702 start_codon:yes stop_codon:yes gene_type:complete
MLIFLITNKFLSIMKYFSISILALMIGAISFVSCSKEEVDNEGVDVHVDDVNGALFLRAGETEYLTNEVIIQKLQSRIEDNFGEGGQAISIVENMNFDNALITTFPGENIKCITIELSGNYSFVSYSNGNDVWKGGYIVETTINSGSSNVKILNLFLEEIVGFSAVDGVVVSVNNYGENPDFTASWYSPWVDCVEDKINTLANNPVLGLGCMAIGPECAGGIAIGCAVIIAFF